FLCRPLSHPVLHSFPTRRSSDLASPVVKRDPPIAYVGAIVLGHKVTNDLAQKLVSSLNVDVGFFLGDDDVAGSKTIALDHTKMIDRKSTRLNSSHLVISYAVFCL